MKPGDLVIAKENKSNAITAGNLYKIEEVYHPKIKDSGLIKLEGVRDYWNRHSFIIITEEIKQTILKHSSEQQLPQPPHCSNQ